MIRKVCAYADPISATGWHMVLGGVPLLLGSGQWESEQWVHLQGSAWIAMTYAAVFGSAIAYGLFFYFASKGNLTSLSSLTFLTPVFALIFGHWLLDEVLSSIQFLGVCLTLVSIYLVNQRDQIHISELKHKSQDALASVWTLLQNRKALDIQVRAVDSSGE